MHSLDQKDKGNGAGRPREREKDLQGLYACDFKQVRVCMRSRGNTSIVFKCLYFYNIDVTLTYVLEMCEMKTSEGMCVCLCWVKNCAGLLSSLQQHLCQLLYLCHTVLV